MKKVVVVLLLTCFAGCEAPAYDPDKDPAYKESQKRRVQILEEAQKRRNQIYEEQTKFNQLLVDCSEARIYDGVWYCENKSLEVAVKEGPEILSQVQLAMATISSRVDRAVRQASLFKDLMTAKGYSKRTHPDKIKGTLPDDVKIKLIGRLSMAGKPSAKDPNRPQKSPQESPRALEEGD